MEVGPTTHYIMGGIRVDARHADVDACRVCSPRANARPASTAPTAWAATRSPTCSCSASAPASTRRSSRSEHAAGAIDDAEIDAAAKRGARAVRARRGGESPYKVQHDLQEMMQDLVGIVRNEAEMRRALEGIERAAAARRRGRRHRQSRVQPRLAHRARPGEPADRLRSRSPARRSSARKAAAGISARTIPDKDPAFAGFNTIVPEGAGRRDAGPPRADLRDARRS